MRRSGRSVAPALLLVIFMGVGLSLAPHEVMAQSSFPAPAAHETENDIASFQPSLHPDAQYTLADALITNAPLDLDQTARPRKMAVPVNVPRSMITTVFIPHIEANIGDKTTLEMRLKDAGLSLPFLRKLGVKAFRAVLQFNASIIAFDEPQRLNALAENQHTLVVEQLLPRGELSKGIIFSLPASITMGNAVESELRIVAFEWLDAQGNAGRFSQTRLENGRLLVKDVWNWDNDRPRIIQTARPLSLSISPNPMKASASFEVDNVTEPPSLRIFNVLGQLVLDASALLPKNDRQFTVSLLRSNLPSAGLYYCHLQCGDTSVTQVLVIE